MVESLQGVAVALTEDVVEVEDEHHHHTFLVLDRDDVCSAQEVRSWKVEVIVGGVV